MNVSISMTHNQHISNKLKLLVYSRDENGNILTSSQEFSADSCDSAASPKASWSSEKLTPSSEVDFKLKGSPEALCGYSIVDKSVDLVSNPNKVTKPKLQVTNSLNELIFYVIYYIILQHTRSNVIHNK